VIVDLHPVFSKPAGHRGMEIYEDPNTGKQRLDTYIKVPKYLDVPPSRSEAVRGQPEPLVSLPGQMYQEAHLMILCSGFFTDPSGHWWNRFSEMTLSWTPCENPLSRENQFYLKRSHTTISNRRPCCWLSVYGIDLGSDVNLESFKPAFIDTISTILPQSRKPSSQPQCRNDGNGQHVFVSSKKRDHKRAYAYAFKEMSTDHCQVRAISTVRSVNLSHVRTPAA